MYLQVCPVKENIFIRFCVVTKTEKKQYSSHLRPLVVQNVQISVRGSDIEEMLFVYQGLDTDMAARTEEFE